MIPITLGTVLIAEGMLTYFGPNGWLSQFLQLLHLYDGPIRLTHNYWGVLISLVDLGLSVRVPADPVVRHRHRPGARARRGDARRRVRRRSSGTSTCRCWRPGSRCASASSFVQAFSVFPSAVLLGSPAGPTRVISIAAYEAAFESYDYSLASAIAMIMGFVQLLIVAAVLGAAQLLLSRPGDAEARADGDRHHAAQARMQRRRARQHAWFDRALARRCCWAR